MKQLVILSGKGGTGKTSLTAAFAHLAHAGPSARRAVLADADVDAANLELVLQPRVVQQYSFAGGPIAEIDPDDCNACGTCASVCRFAAVHSFLTPPPQLVSVGEPGPSTRPAYAVDPMACDGCAACVYQCPTQAIHMKLPLAGQWFRSDSRYGPLFHAALRPAQANSGKLVTLVKQQARLLALDESYPVVIVDGPPGIGCPVISAVSGADLAVIVTEPTEAGLHDMERALKTTARFSVPAVVCINKADIYPGGTAQIEAYCHASGIPVIGRIPFDPTVTEAMVHGDPVTEFRADAPASRAITAIWQTIVARLEDLQVRA